MPCDGEVIDGLAAVDESMLTGESVLVPKGVGAAVAGGCIVFEAPLTIRASATGAESTLAGVWAVLRGVGGGDGLDVEVKVAMCPASRTVDRPG